jgi:hypothetical protein
MFRLFTSENCAPCRGVIAYLNAQHPTLKYESVYHHIRPDLFTFYNIKATPTFVADKKVVALGYDNIIAYVNSLTFFDVTEEEE